MTNTYFVDFKNFDINTEGRGTSVTLPVILAIVPMLGALFLMFLPVIGFYLLAEMIVTRIKEFTLSYHVGDVAVGASYLTGHDVGVEKKDKPADDDKLKNLEKKVADLRK